MLGAAEVAQLEDARLGVEQQVLRLDVPVADAQRVDVGQAAEQLVHVQLDEADGDRLLGPAVVAGHLVDRLGNILQH